MPTKQRKKNLRSSQSLGVPLPYLSNVAGSSASLRYSSAPCHNTFFSPNTCGLCGSSAVSHFAWCLRWIATLSWVVMRVINQNQKRGGGRAAGGGAGARGAGGRGGGGGARARGGGGGN